jgi:hypothetical protein
MTRAGCHDGGLGRIGAHASTEHESREDSVNLTGR